jgi:hypothetical protein
LHGRREGCARAVQAHANGVGRSTQNVANLFVAESFKRQHQHRAVVFAQRAQGHLQRLSTLGVLESGVG